MTDILTITFPIYAAIAIGYLVVLKGWFTQADMRSFGKYVMNIAMPALLFNAVASRDVGEVLHWGYLAAYTLGGVATIVIAFLWFSVTARDKSRRAIAVLGSTCPNSGFIGYPLMLLTFPEIAGIVLALNMLVELIVLIPVCLVLMDMARDGAHQSPVRQIAGNIANTFKRPMMLGLLLGLAVSALNLPVPGPVDHLFRMIAASAAALSLIVIGGSLVGLPLKGNRLFATQISAAKLFLHPAMVFLAVLALPALGIAPLDPQMFAAVILSAAISMFGIYTVLAQESGLEGLASIAMLIATSTAFFTLSALLMLLT
ncbi:AEC family transporter [Shimia sediminis]|uniref:AEC family transporter n=1 Tax=Shimia sediminis TaxID=2497945 RepID=UPI000F8D68D7|nr:AEC family transporter [Shimia sediminis]